MTETIIFSCGVLSGLLGYFIRMGLLHDRKIKNMIVDIESAFKLIEENREYTMKEIERRQTNNDADIQNLHNRIGLTHTQIEETYKYTDKRIDKVTDKFGMLLNKTA